MFLRGVFNKTGVWLWCSGGENVVECVVKRGELRDGFVVAKKLPLFPTIFFG
jgi:hypothetical protein